MIICVKFEEKMNHYQILAGMFGFVPTVISLAKSFGQFFNRNSLMLLWVRVFDV